MNRKYNVSKKWVINLIREFLISSPHNTIQDESRTPAWDDVLVGFAWGADPIWQQYKEYVGGFHWTPWEVFTQHHPGEIAGGIVGETVTAETLTVISWVLPQRKIVRQSNRKARKYPSEPWARIRVFGEAFNVELRRHVVQALAKAGHAAVAPMLVPNWTIVNSRQFSYASSWSERHAAHAAGLGTFGLCDGLITPKGKAMRAGSVVVKASIEPTPRLYNDHRAFCLFFDNGTCGKCIDRCPVGAITKSGHDKEKCRQHLGLARKYVKKTYRFEGYGCGLCQVGVPCEAGIPVRKAREAVAQGKLPPAPPPLA